LRSRRQAVLGLASVRFVLPGAWDFGSSGTHESGIQGPGERASLRDGPSRQQTGLTSVSKSGQRFQRFAIRIVSEEHLVNLVSASVVIWLVRRFGACAGPRAFPKGTLHLNGEPIASPFAPRFKCKFRDFVCKMTLHLIPEPEEKASELLRDLTAKLFCSMCQPEEDHPGPLNDF